MIEHTFDSKDFLGNRENDSDIYTRSPMGYFFSPFSLAVRETERLMMFNVVGDPHYSVIELQRLNDRGQAAVILYDKKGKVNVYHSKDAEFDPDIYHWASNWRVVGECAIEHDFNISDHGVDAWLKMEDEDNRLVEFMVKENDPQKQFSNILAPLGFEHEDPQFFPFLYLNRISPTKAEGTQIEVSIDGMAREASFIPVKINNQRMYHTRYSDDPFLGIWNKNFEGTLSPIQADQVKDRKAVVSDAELALVDNGGHWEIARITGKAEKHSIYFHFVPSVPDVISMKNSVKVAGRFVGGVDDREAVMGGEYAVKREQDRVRISIGPNKGWQPVPGKLWLSSFRWLAELNLKGQDVVMKAGWTLKKGGLHEFFYKKLK